MSTLGRKAMKKTLKRLKKDALRDANRCLNVFKKLGKEVDKMSEKEEELFDLFREYVPRAVVRLMRYIQALEDYGYELDGAWDKLLKTVEQAKPVQKQEEAKKTSYIK